MPEAATTLLLEARIAELEAALRPFATMAEWHERRLSEDKFLSPSIYVSVSSHASSAGFLISSHELIQAREALPGSSFATAKAEVA